jgi:hypothetical protein
MRCNKVHGEYDPDSFDEYTLLKRVGPILCLFIASARKIDG